MSIKCFVINALSLLCVIMLEGRAAEAQGNARVSWDPAFGPRAAVWEARSGSAGSAWQIRVPGPPSGGDLAGWASVVRGGDRVVLGTVTGPVPVRRRPVDPFLLPGEVASLRGTVRGGSPGVAWRRDAGATGWTAALVRTSDGRTAPAARARMRAWRLAWDARGRGHVGWRSSWAGAACGAEVRTGPRGTEVRAGLLDAGAAATVILERAPSGGWSPGGLAGIGVPVGWARGLRVVWMWWRQDPERTGWRAEWKCRPGPWNLTLRGGASQLARADFSLRAQRSLGPGLLLQSGLVIAADDRHHASVGLRRTRSGLRGGAELELGSAGRSGEIWGAVRSRAFPELRFRVRLRAQSAPRWNLALEVPLGERPSVRSSR